MCAPENECDKEIYIIIGEINKRIEILEFSKISTDVFDDFFGDEYNKERLYLFINESYANLKKKEYFL